MADFSYDTVRRAAQEASSNLQSSLNDLRDNLRNWRNDSRTAETQNRVHNIERVLNDLIPTVQRMDSLLQQVYNHGYNQENWRTQFDSQKFNQRLANIERYASEVSRYLEQLHNQMGRIANSSDQNVQ